jgi:uncharacterized protein
MIPAPVHVAGERLMLDPSGVLFWPREGVLALAERPAASRLAFLRRRWRPRRVVVLAEESWEAAPLAFRGTPAAGAQGEIAGRPRPEAEGLPCFVADAVRVLLPSPGGAAGSGEDVHGPVIRALFPHGARVFVLGARRFSSFPVAGRGRLQFRARII